MTVWFGHRHFEAIAQVFNDLPADDDTSEVDDAVQSLARMFATDNPRFDRTRFLTACGYDPRLFN